MAKELQQKEQEIEQIQHDSFIEMERVRTSIIYCL